MAAEKGKERKRTSKKKRRGKNAVESRKGEGSF